MNVRSVFVVGSLVGALLLVQFRVEFGNIANGDEPASAAAQKPKSGLLLGERVPTTSMRWIVGQDNDRNTCLAGRYARRRAVSVYLGKAAEPQYDAVLKRLDALLADHEELKGYVLLLDGSQFDAELKANLRRRAAELKLARVDVAIANSSRKDFGLEQEAALVVVLSAQRIVKFHSELPPQELNDQAVQAVFDQLAAAAAE